MTHLLRAVVVAGLLCLSLTHYSAWAAPTLPPAGIHGAPAATSISARSGSDRMRLETPTPSIPTGEPFGYTARVTLKKPAERVQIRFRASHPSGRLIFQRTRVFNDAKAGTIHAEFERATDDLDLRPGVFPVELEITITRGGSSRTTVVSTGLLVFDEASPALAVVPVVRIDGQPLSDSTGRFVADPARFTQPRDDVRALASWILTEPRAQLTLAVGPLLLEEWRSIAGGYELAGPEGVETFGPESDAAVEYATTLRVLERALATGRLELAATGYSDPDLSDLADARLLDDIVPQYKRGAASVAASLEATVSTGTVPAGGCIPPSAAALLGQAGVGYAVVEDGCTRPDDATATPSSYRTASGLVVLVPDATISGAAARGDTSSTVGLAFERMLDERARGPLVLTADLGMGGEEVTDFITGVESLFPHPWTRMSTGRGVATRPKRSVRLSKGAGGSDDPTGFWKQAREARRWARALNFAVGEADPDAVIAERSSLIAQCSAWAGADGTWVLADRGRSFSETAGRLGTEVLGTVGLALEPVTLPGSKGNVPVTLKNGSDRTLTVRLVLETQGGARVEGTRTRTVELGPKETFLEVPVDLGNTLSGGLKVSVVAGDVVLDDASVTLRASYLDRVATIGGVVLVLIVLLGFIIKRVRAAEREVDAVTNREAYTETTSTRGSGGRV